MSEADDSIRELIDRVEGVRTVMLTTVDERGTLSSRPLTVQRIDPSGDVYFIVDRHADWVGGTAEPVNIALVDPDRTWVSVAGRLTLVDDRALLDDLWDSMTDAFFPDGKEGGPTVLRVQADRWEYWTAPNKLTQTIEIVKAKLTGGVTDLGDSGSVET